MTMFKKLWNQLEDSFTAFDQWHCDRVIDFGKFLQREFHINKWTLVLITVMAQIVVVSLLVFGDIENKSQGSLIFAMFCHFGLAWIAWSMHHRFEELGAEERWVETDIEQASKMVRVMFRRIDLIIAYFILVMTLAGLEVNHLKTALITIMYLQFCWTDSGREDKGRRRNLFKEPLTKLT